MKDLVFVCGLVLAVECAAQIAYYDHEDYYSQPIENKLSNHLHQFLPLRRQLGDTISSLAPGLLVAGVWVRRPFSSLLSTFLSASG